MFIFRNIRYSLFLLLMIFLAIGNNVYSQKEVLPFTKSDSALITKLSNYQKHFKSNGNKKQESRFLDKLAFLYWRHFMLKEAEGYYNQSLENYKSVNDRKLIASTNTNLALLNSDIGNYAKSISYFDKAIEINKVGKHKRQYINNLKDKATVFSKQKKYNTAIESVNTALKKSEESNDNSNIKECYGMLAEFYKKNGNNEKSLFYYKKFLGIKDGEQIADNTSRNTNIEDNSNNKPDNTNKNDNNNPDNNDNNDNQNNTTNNNNSTDLDNNVNNTNSSKYNDSNSGDNDVTYDDAINNHNENSKDTNRTENNSIDESDSLAVNNSDTSDNLSKKEGAGEAVVIAKKSRLSCQNIILIAIGAFILFVLIYLLVRNYRKKAKQKDNKRVANAANSKVKKSKQQIKTQKTKINNTESVKPVIEEKIVEKEEPIKVEDKKEPIIPITNQKAEKLEPVKQEIKEKEVEKEEPIKVEDKKEPIIPITNQKAEKLEPVKQEIKEEKAEKEEPVKVEDKEEPIIPITNQKAEKLEPVKQEIKEEKAEKEEPIKVVEKKEPIIPITNQKAEKNESKKPVVGKNNVKEPFDIDGLVRNVKYKDNFDIVSKFLPGAFIAKVNENKPCLISVKKENTLRVFIIEETKGHTCKIDLYENLIKTIESSNLPTDKLIKKISSVINKADKSNLEYNLACLNFDINKTTIEYTGANLPLIFVKNKIPHLLSGNSGTLPLSRKHKPFVQTLKLSGDTNFYVISRKFYVNKVINQEYVDTIKRTISGINSEYTLQEKKDILERQVSNIVENSGDNSGIILGFKA